MQNVESAKLEQLQVDLPNAFFTVDRLTCHGRKSTGVTNKVMAEFHLAASVCIVHTGSFLH